MEIPGHRDSMRLFLFAPDTDLLDESSRALDAFPGVAVVRTFNRWPDEQEVTRLFKIYAPNVVALDVSRPDLAARLAELVRQVIPGTQIIAIHHSCEPEVLLQVMRLGIQEFLSRPFHEEAVSECLQRLRSHLRESSSVVNATHLVYSFLPAKAGSGTTTLAVNAAIAAARTSKDPIFFGDFDLSTGVVRFMLNLANDYSVVDAVSAGTVDESTWSRLVSQKYGVDFMHAGRLQPETRVDPASVGRLVDFLPRPYKVVCADLSGNFEKYSIEIMRQSRRVFVVTTPELPCLHLARDRVAYLTSLDLGDRITVLLNRAVKRSPLSEREISELVGKPIFATFTNDYVSVTQALEKATPIRQDCELGKQLAQFGAQLI